MTVVFGAGQATYSFTAAPTGNGPGAAVSTAGSAQVSTDFGSITDFFSGSTIDQTGEFYTFAAYPTAATIPFSATDDFIGLSFTLGDGVHYGDAEVAGSSLVSYAYESTPGGSILTGATPTILLPDPTAPPNPPSGVPEPGALALLAIGFTGASVGRRKRGSQ